MYRGVKALRYLFSNKPGKGGLHSLQQQKLRNPQPQQPSTPPPPAPFQLTPAQVTSQQRLIPLLSLQFIPCLYYSTQLFLTPTYSPLFPLYLSRMTLLNSVSIFFTSTQTLTLGLATTKLTRQYKYLLAASAVACGLCQLVALPPYVPPTIMVFVNAGIMTLERRWRAGRQRQEEEFEVYIGRYVMMVRGFIQVLLLLQILQEIKMWRDRKEVSSEIDKYNQINKAEQVKQQQG